MVVGMRPRRGRTKFVVVQILGAEPSYLHAILDTIAHVGSFISFQSPWLRRAINMFSSKRQRSPRFITSPIAMPS